MYCAYFTILFFFFFFTTSTIFTDVRSGISWILIENKTDKALLLYTLLKRLAQTLNTALSSSCPDDFCACVWIPVEPKTQSAFTSLRRCLYSQCFSLSFEPIHHLWFCHCSAPIFRGCPCCTTADAWSLSLPSVMGSALFKNVEEKSVTVAIIWKCSQCFGKIQLARRFFLTLLNISMLIHTRNKLYLTDALLALLDFFPFTWETTQLEKTLFCLYI